MRLKQEETAMLLVDVQERLWQHMEEKEALKESLSVLLQGLQCLHIPILCNQQYTKGLGETIAPLKAILTKTYVYEKQTFSCCQNSDVIEALKALHVKKVILAGIESHVCVLQTALDLLDLGYEVIACGDAMRSRKSGDHAMALRRMESEGVVLGSTESILFELLGGATHPQFKQISTLIKTL